MDLKLLEKDTGYEVHRLTLKPGEDQEFNGQEDDVYNVIPVSGAFRHEYRIGGYPHGGLARVGAQGQGPFMVGKQPFTLTLANPFENDAVIVLVLRFSTKSTS